MNHHSLRPQGPLGSIESFEPLWWIRIQVVL